MTKKEEALKREIERLERENDRLIRLLADAALILRRMKNGWKNNEAQI